MPSAVTTPEVRTRRSKVVTPVAGALALALVLTLLAVSWRDLRAQVDLAILRRHLDARHRDGLGRQDQCGLLCGEPGLRDRLESLAATRPRALARALVDAELRDHVARLLLHIYGDDTLRAWSELDTPAGREWTERWQAYASGAAPVPRRARACGDAAMGARPGAWWSQSDGSIVAPDWWPHDGIT